MKAVRQVLVTLALIYAGPVLGAEPNKSVIVLAAASLTDAVTEVSEAFTRQTQVPVKTSFAASSALARQIEAGAHAGIFISADEEWMDYLEQRRMIVPGTRRNVLANRLVVIVPADSTIASIDLHTAEGFLSVVQRSHIATGDPDSVPVGRYAKAALTRLGAWDKVAPQLVRADNVRAALAFVARGEAPFGIVYLTDAQIEKHVKPIGTFPAELHQPIRYPIAVTNHDDAKARRFAAFVSSPEAIAIFEKYGFEIVR